ncbi:hypothetical protein PR202_ga29551 [Eleusine coracana subsp. coracana]|uniref:DAGKc domain-containing protein n=1 Tax=Eleusine coracana subsp. coracana TaxID=191504 RepID=A0AAV5DN83_ELECO|nr:hypothetical protein PR202_ga29551 [Eleusine coracana subsp. coracana]
MADPQVSEVLADPARVNGAAAEATLSGGELAWRPCGGGDGQRLELESEVLGCRVEGRKLKLATFLCGGGGEQPPAMACGGGKGDGRTRRRRGEVAMEMESEDAAARWGDAVRDRLASLETKHRFHGQEMSHSLDLRKYDGIICVSGDGVLVEVVNGLLQREDWETAIKVPLGIIPAGTGNGMAQSLLHAAGHKRALDVTSVVQGKTRFFSVLMLTWGLVADLDIESEKYRWMGSARLEFYFLVRVLNLRRYNGRVLFVPAPGYEEVGDPVEASTSCKPNAAATSVDGDKANDTNGETCGYQGPSIQEADLQWRSLNGPFVSVWLGNVPFASEDAMAAPKAEFSDGYLDVAIIKDCPRWDVLGLMFQMKDGAYIESPYVEYFKVKAIRIEPGMRVGSSNKGGIIDSDGEVLARGDGPSSGGEPEHLMEYAPVQLTVDRGLATIFSPR